MKYVVTGYEPEKLFRFFEDISAIPRGSGNEKGIADYLENFAKDRGLEYFRDEYNSILIKKPATKGYEKKDTVLLQGHTDMVCEKNFDCDHDFEKDGLELYIENGRLRAKGTTLGSDDGIAVAAMLCALDSDIAHPNLECLFTVGEETGLIGANNFDYSKLKAKRLINLDSESEGEAITGCAGGIEMIFSLKPERLPLPDIYRPLEFKISGLAGGHSGDDIIKERGNAIKLMWRLISRIYESTPFSIVTISGGNRSNAIPRESRAVIFTSEPETALEIAKNTEKMIKSELPEEDRGFKLSCGKAKGYSDKMLSLADTDRLLSIIGLMPCGVISRIPTMPDMVQTSNSLGILRDDSETIELFSHGRSSVDSNMDDLAENAKSLAKLTGAGLRIESRYSGWSPVYGSPLQKDFMKVASAIYDSPCLKTIHAGLECGIIVSAMPGLDAISIGPDAQDIHTPNESLGLESAERFWKLIEGLLKI